MRAAITLIAAMLLSSPASADDMADMMAKLPAPAFTSEKSSLALEYCIGLGMSHWFQLTTLHGEKRTLLGGAAGMGGTMALLVVIDDSGSRRSVSTYSSKGWNDRAAALISSCV